VKAIIIDYQMGNVASVQKALNFLHIENMVSNDPLAITNAEYIILPGVGSFSQGMENLHRHKLVDLLTEEVVVNKKPFLGICLGMQLLATKGTEPIECEGLNWIDGDVVKIEDSCRRIPHLGWNSITIKNPNSIINKFNNKDFYFIHSYHFNISDKSNIAAVVNYGNDYVAAIQRDNIFATQFHPEKSQKFGIALLKSFFDFYAED